MEHPFSYHHRVDQLALATPQHSGMPPSGLPHLSHSTTFPEANVSIPEEDEDETGSEPTEAVTPTSESHPPSFAHHDGAHDDKGGALSSSEPAAHKPPLIINTAATPPRKTHVPPSSSTPKPSAPDITPQRLQRTASNSIRKLFRRSMSSGADLQPVNQLTMSSLNGSSGNFSNSQSKPNKSQSKSTSNTPATSQSNTPPSPGSPATTVNQNDPSWQAADLEGKKVARASTGFNMGKGRIAFSTSQRPAQLTERKRSTSVTNLQGLGDMRNGEYFTRHAATGVGLKARRMSLSLPDDFIVDTCELDTEYTSASKLPGKKKLLGKGATATVKLMTRKGHGDEIYAVKEFRKKSTTEDQDEYNKKVKSEFTIAKSLHHPNIVESIQLCTHSGRWNVVMEFCQYGELFTLVQRKYLKPEDELCLWKQLLRGVAYLHTHGIAHRDIKLENLLMNGEGKLKITDFGVSEVFCGEHPGVRGADGECGKNMKERRLCAPGICGSLPYIAPEVLEKKGDS